MMRRVTVLALFAVALFTGFRYSPPETKESIQKALSDVYTSCVEHPKVALTIEGVSPYVSIGIEKLRQAMEHAYVALPIDGVSAYVRSGAEKFWQALARINLNSEGVKRWFIANTSWFAVKTSEQVVALQAFSSNKLADVKEYSLSMFSQLQNSEMVADSKARILATSSQVLLWLRGLSPMQQTIVAVAIIAMVMVVLAMSCRRRSKVNASVGDTVVVAQAATSNDGGAQESLRRRRSRSRCDSPRPTSGNDENAAPPSNRLDGAESVLSQINTATSDELLRFSGLGEKSVQKIMKYRSKHGEIQELEELVGKVGLARVVVTKIAKVHGL